jgi:pimeloyl-ACP methyl ester carboxylesterase
MLAGIVGFGPILRRTGRAIVATYRAGGRTPIIVVGHSAGGIAARLAMSEEPFHGRRAGVSEAVGCLVTLGTPHGLNSLDNRYQHAGHEAADFLERTSPGAFFAPRTGYLTVGSRLRAKAGPDRFSSEIFQVIVGAAAANDGDGIVPLAAAHLAGARQITLEGVRHGMIGTPWYGDRDVMARWWPVALELWREALDARSEARFEHDSTTALEFEVAGWSSGSSSGS